MFGRDRTAAVRCPVFLPKQASYARAFTSQGWPRVRCHTWESAPSVKSLSRLLCVLA